MFAVFKREFLSYFRTPVGWVAISLLGIISGYYFIGMLTSSFPYVNIAAEIAYIRSFFVVLIPIITMRLFAEEKRNGTDVLLYTMPYSMMDAVLGKFLAALALQGIMIMSVFSHMIITVICSGNVNSATWGAIFGYIILAGLLISIGMLTSAMTENQIMSAVICFVVILFIAMLSNIANTAGEIFKSFLRITGLYGMNEVSIYNAGENLKNAIIWLDPYTKTSCFTSGVVKIVPLIYCVSFTVVFIFITYRVLEKKRWSQN